MLTAFASHLLFATFEREVMDAVSALNIPFFSGLVVLCKLRFSQPLSELSVSLLVFRFLVSNFPILLL